MSTDTRATRRPYAGPSRLQAILEDVESTLRRIYGDRFAGLVLFGSHARGTADQGSDVDPLLLLQDCAGT